MSYDAATKTATLDPAADLKAGKTYQAWITTGAKDLQGNSLSLEGSPYSGDGSNNVFAWRFTLKNTST